MLTPPLEQALGQLKVLYRLLLLVLLRVPILLAKERTLVTSIKDWIENEGMDLAHEHLDLAIGDKELSKERTEILHSWLAEKPG